MALGEVKEGTDKAKKWLHALKLDPSVVSDAETADTTANPFVAIFAPRPPLPTPISTGGMSAETVQKLMSEDQAKRGQSIQRYLLFIINILYIVLRTSFLRADA